MITQINRLKTNFNYDDIDKDFVVAKLEDKNKKHICANLFLSDFQDETNIKILSSVFNGYGERCLFLLIDRRDYSLDKLKRHFKNNVEILINEITIKEIKRDESLQMILIQLFINSLIGKNFRIKENLTGRYLYILGNGKVKDQIKCVEFKIDNEGFVEVALRTFSKINENNYQKTYKNKKPYIRNQFVEEGMFLKKVKTKPYNPHDKYFDNIYVEKAHSLRKNSTPYAGVSPDKQDTYFNSKTYVFSNVLLNINKRYSRYLSVNTEKAYYEKIMRTASSKDTFWKKDRDFSDMVKALSSQKINIIDKTSPDDNALKLKRLISARYGIPEENIFLSEKPDSDKLNIEIIHNKDYYDKNGFADEYFIYDKSIVLQHITVEDTLDILGMGKKDSSLDVIMKELVVKSDIKNKKISILDFSMFGLTSPIIFAKALTENTVGVLVILPDGSLEYFTDFRVHDKSYDKLIGLVAGNNKVIGIQYKNNISVISESKISVLPNTSELYRLFCEGGYNPNTTINKNEIEENWPELKTATELPNEIEFSELMDRIEKPQKKKYSTKISKYLYDTKNSWSNNYYRCEDFVSIFYDSLVGINVLNYEGKNLYYVGVFTSQKFSSIEKKPVLREITVLEGENITDILLPMLSVEFVKWGNETVLPMPVKYFNEIFPDRIYNP